RRLVADIGGGSTEIIIGEGLHAKKLESLHMGCVSMSARMFSDGVVTEKRMKRARLAARLELEPVQTTFKDLGWEHAVGSSGTIRSVCDVLRGTRFGNDGSITPQGVELVIEQLLRVGDLSKRRLPGLADERVPVFPGGLAILAEVLNVLDLKTMKVADGALREG